MIAIDKIIEAKERLNNVISPTPLQHNMGLSRKYACNIYLKREDLQNVRSFKIRGAYNKIKYLSEQGDIHDIVCASAGNHAQGVAYACHSLSIKATIFMPTTTPKQKISKVKYFGGSWVDIVLTGDTFDDCQLQALDFANKRNYPFIHPFDDELVIAGQGTVGVEILAQASEHIDYLLIAVGGGGLLSGIGSYFHTHSPNTKIIALESQGAAALTQSIKENKRISLEHIDSFADGIAVKSIGEYTFPICKEVIDRVITIPEGHICSSILNLYNDEAIVLEPAGAIGFSALDVLKDELVGKNVVIVVSGGNNDITRTEDIRERALLWENKKHYFIIRFPQRAGALKDFLNVLGPNDDISHFEYTKKNNRDTGPALIGIELSDKNDFVPLIERMKSSNIVFEHLNDNPTLFQMLI